MPRRTVAIDYQACKPEECEEGICKAVVVCEKKLLIQIEPYEPPETRPTLCMSCAQCVVACPEDAIKVF